MSFLDLLVSGIFFDFRFLDLDLDEEDFDEIDLEEVGLGLAFSGELDEENEDLEEG